MITLPGWAIVLGGAGLAGFGLLVGTIRGRGRGRRASERAAPFLPSGIDPELLSKAIHDLRQPVQAAELFVAALGRGGGRSEGPGEGPDQGTAGLVGGVQAALAELRVRLDALSTVGKVDGGMLEPRLTSFPVQEVLDEAVSSRLAAAERAGVDLRLVDCAAGIRSDRVLLGRLVAALIDDGIARAGEKGRILVGCRRSGSHVRIEVLDTGSAASAATAAALFSDRPGGEGSLTQVMAQRLGRLLGHPLSAGGGPGGGLRFTTRLPRAEGTGGE